MQADIGGREEEELNLDDSKKTWASSKIFPSRHWDAKLLLHSFGVDSLGTLLTPVGVSLLYVLNDL
jgi:hypothetical protein